MRFPVGYSCCFGQIALIALTLCGNGCGRADHPRTYPVKGTLEINGQPAAGVTLIFIANPPIEQLPSAPTAVTESDGSFALTTFRAKDGAPVGEYNVILSWPEWRKGFKAGPDRLNQAFGDATKSTLKAKVEARQNELPLRVVADLKPTAESDESASAVPSAKQTRKGRN